MSAHSASGRPEVGAQRPGATPGGRTGNPRRQGPTVLCAMAALVVVRM
jgi:hypothetical protein